MTTWRRVWFRFETMVLLIVCSHIAFFARESKMAAVKWMGEYRKTETKLVSEGNETQAAKFKLIVLQVTSIYEIQNTLRDMSIYSAKEATNTLNKNVNPAAQQKKISRVLLSMQALICVRKKAAHIPRSVVSTLNGCGGVVGRNSRGCLIVAERQGVQG